MSPALAQTSDSTGDGAGAPALRLGVHSGRVDVLSALSTLGGAARREQLLALGATRYQMDRALARGVIVRYRPGCLALLDADPRVMVARAMRSHLTCVSALELWDLPVLDPVEATHVAVPVNRGMARASAVREELVTVHHSVHIGRAHDPAVAPWVALDHLGRCVSPLAQLVAIDAALNRQLVTEAVLDRFTVTDLRRRRWLAQSASRSAESLLETLTRVALRESGLRVVPQVSIAGVGRVDLLVDNCVVVELDGRSYHSDDIAFGQDRKRDRTLALAGYLVLRFTYRDVVFNCPRVVSEVQHAVDLMAGRTSTVTSTVTSTSTSTATSGCESASVLG